ncbi:Rieske Fe-S protein [Mumia flava]|uniref:Cytochrome bc1 complex Rieske iron-sulfur subunit n=1 Tax=Mumia flava TaxID=1348852 RepID=A0A0B2B8N5_9ACTN|nr:Rieske (2Fe-2S) protein [Mumia flava]PJJ53619.1 Rieske Fe-S protein [Mumia flava]
MTEPLDRRRVLQGVAVVGGATVATSLLAACGEDTSGSTGSGSGARSDAASDPATTDGGSDGGGGGGTVLGSTSDVPVGGGRLYEGEKVIVTQPTEGEFVGFSAVCTHQGCIVSLIEDDTMTCPCHNSEFSAEDGSVLGGPASEPLPSVAVSVSGDEIVLG